MTISRDAPLLLRRFNIEGRETLALKRRIVYNRRKCALLTRGGSSIAAKGAAGNKIFISYRREDADDAAGRIRDWLVQTRRVAKDDVFMDVTGILPGDDFVEVIEKKIAQCRAMIVLISPSWLNNINTEAGKYLRMEAEAALRQAESRGLRIIPVLVGGAAMPTAEQLPEGLRSLTKRSGTPVRAASFDYDMGLVRKALGIGAGIRPAWVAVVSLVILVALSLGVLSQVPADPSNPIWTLFNPPTATATATDTPTATATATATPKPLTADEILARSRSATYRDMSGRETRTDTAGYSTRGTIVLTLNPARSEEVLSDFDPQGNLLQQDDVIRNGTARYQHILTYNTNPPTDDGWRQDAQPFPDPRPWTNIWLDPFTSATTLIGTETINGVNAYHLQIQLAATSKMDVWIRADNFYLVQLTDTEGSVQAFLISMTAWDTGLTINVPTV